MKNYQSERVFIKEIEINDITDRVMSWFEDEELMRYYSNSRNRITKENLLQSIAEGKKTVMCLPMAYMITPPQN